MAVLKFCPLAAVVLCPSKRSRSLIMASKQSAPFQPCTLLKTFGEVAALGT